MSTLQASELFYTGHPAAAGLLVAYQSAHNLITSMFFTDPKPETRFPMPHGFIKECNQLGPIETPNSPGFGKWQDSTADKRWLRKGSG